MTSTKQATLPCTAGESACTARLSKQLLKGLQTETQKVLSAPKETQMEAIGLLFGVADRTSVRIEQFEPVQAAEFGTRSGVEREHLHKAFEKRIAECRSNRTGPLSLVGWYSARNPEQAGLLQRDTEIHNRYFLNQLTITLISRLEPNGSLSMGLYSAKPHSFLSMRDHRAGSLRMANVDALGHYVDISLTDTANDELFLKVLVAAKSRDRAERRWRWLRVQRYAGLLTSIGVGRTRTDEHKDFAIGGNRREPDNAPVSPARKERAIVTGPVLNGDVALRAQTSVAGRGNREKTGISNLPPAVSKPLSQESGALTALHLNSDVQGYRAPRASATSFGFAPRKMAFLDIAAWFAGTVLLSVVTYIAAHLYVKPALVKLAAQHNAAGSMPTGHGPQPSDAALTLTVSQNGGVLELHWDLRSAAIQTARTGKLVINDGAVAQEFRMDQAQLRSGQIVYSPVFDDVTFRLEVVNSPGHTAVGSVRVLRSFSAASASRRNKVNTARSKGKLIARPVGVVHSSSPASNQTPRQTVP